MVMEPAFTHTHIHLQTQAYVVLDTCFNEYTGRNQCVASTQRSFCAFRLHFHGILFNFYGILFNGHFLRFNYVELHKAPLQISSTTWNGRLVVDALPNRTHNLYGARPVVKMQSNHLTIVETRQVHIIHIRCMPCNPWYGSITTSYYVTI